MNLLTAMTGVEILTAIIQILVGGISSVAQAVGAGLSTIAQNVFLTSDGSALSVFGILVCVFAGIGLAISLCRAVVMFVGSLGGKKVR